MMTLFKQEKMLKQNIMENTDITIKMIKIILIYNNDW